MAQDSRVFESRDHSESELAEIWQDMAPDGVFDFADNKLAVSAPGGMLVNIATGRAMIQGFWYKNTSIVGLAIAANGTASTRIDWVVLRLDRATNSVVLAIRQGTAGAGAPALTRAVGGSWELGLAQVSVAAGAVNIAPANVTDYRSNYTFCGWASQRSTFSSGGANGSIGFLPFDLDLDTGLQNPSANQLDLIVGGINQLSVSPTLARLGLSSTTVALYANTQPRVTADSTTVTIGGTGVTQITIGSAAAALAIPSQINTLIAAYHAGPHLQLLSPDGSAATQQFANNQVVGSATKSAFLVLGTGASQGLGGSDRASRQRPQ